MKVVITGGTGLLGGTAAITMEDHWSMELWGRGHEATFPGIVCKQVKLENFDEILAALEKSGADLVIHAAGMTSVEECEVNEYRAYLANVLSTKNLARATFQLGKKFVYISTDHVALDKERSREEELGFPCNVYAKTKLEGEFVTIKHNPNALVLRTNFYTWGNHHRKSFLDFIVDNLRNQREVTLFEDVRFNAVSGELLLNYLHRLVRANANGVFNLSSDECITKADFGFKVAEVFGLEKKLIKIGKLSDRTELSKRPMNLTLDNSKLKSTISESSTPTFKDLLLELKKNEVAHKEKLFTHIQPVKESRFISYGKQTIDDSDFEAVLASMDSAWLTQGPTVEAFERAVAKYTGSKYAVAMANWTCGLHMAVLAAGVKPGDYVITSPLSFVASANCAIYAGATPYFVDIDPKTLNIDPIKLEAACRKLGGKVKAIIPVHFAGAPCDMEAISTVAKRYGAILIEDAAHAIGGRYTSGEKIGNNRYSEMVGFSFHPVKNLTTGEGGLITTNSEKVYHKLLRLRSHGITKGGDAFTNTELAFTQGDKNPWYYEMQELGFNFRITDLQCALGLSQLAKLDSFLCRKIEIVKAYDEAFSSLRNIELVQHELRDRSGNHLYVARVNFGKLGFSRFELFKKFKDRRINLHVHYIPIYRQPYYLENYPADIAEFSETERYYSQAVTFPVFPGMNQSQLDDIIRAVRELIG